MDYQDLDALYEDTTPVAPVPTQEPAPAGNSASNAPDLDALYEDAPTPSYYRVGAKPAKSTGGMFDEFKRGLMTSFVQNNPQAIASSLEAFNAMLGGADDNAAGRAADELHSQIEQWTRDNPDYQPTLQKYSQIHGVGDAAKYAAGAVGQTVGSFALPAAGAALGAATGSALAPGPGTAVGAIAGGLSGSYVTNYAPIYDDMKLAGLDRARAARWAAVTAIPVTALDSAGEWTVLEKLVGAGAKREVTRGIAKRIAQEALKGGGVEGVTEALQQVVQDLGTSIASGKQFLTRENFDNWIDNGLQGAIGGGIVSGVGGVRKDKPKTPPPVNPPQTTATNNPGEGDSAGADVGQAGGQPTPGGLGAPPPPPVAPAPQPAAKPVAKPVAPVDVPGTVDSDQQAALTATNAPAEPEEEADTFDETTDEDESFATIEAALRDPTAVAPPAPQPPVQALPEGIGSPEAQARRNQPRVPPQDQVQTIVDAATALIPQVTPTQEAPVVPSAAAVTPTTQPQPPSAPVQAPTPVTQTVAEPDTTGLRGMGSGMGQGINASLRDALWTGYSANGAMRIDPIVKAARYVSDHRGRPMDETEFRQFAEEFGSADSRDTKIGILEKYAGTTQTPAVTPQATPPVEQPPVVPPASPPEAMPADVAQAVPTLQPSLDELYAEPPVAPKLPAGKTPAKTGLLQLKKGRDIEPASPGSGTGPATPSEIAGQEGLHALEPPVRRSRVDDVTRMVAADIRGTLEDHPRDIQDEAIRQAVGEYADEIDSRQHDSIGAAERALREPIRQRAVALAKGLSEDRARNEILASAGQTVAGLTRARQVEQNRRLGGEGSTGQTLERQGKFKGKSPDALARESRKAFFRRLDREMAGPNPPAWAVEAQKAREVVARNKGAGTERQRVRTTHDAIIARVQAELAASEAQKAPKPTETEEAAKRAQEAAEITRAAALSPVEREQAAIQADIAKRRDVHEAHERALKDILKTLPVPAVLPTNRAAYHAWASAHIRAVYRAILAVTGPVKSVSIKNSKAENFVAYVRPRLDAMPESDEQNDALSALLLLESDDQHQFYSMVRSDPGDVMFNQQGVRPVDRHQDSSFQPDTTDWGDLDSFIQGEMRQQVSQIQAAAGDHFELHNYFTNSVVRVEAANRVSLKSVIGKGAMPEGNLGNWAWDKQAINPYSAIYSPVAGRKTVFSAITAMLDRRIHKLIGDMPVFYVSEAQMNALVEQNIGEPQGGRTHGIYTNPSIAERAQGAKGAIILDEALKGNPGLEAYIVRHEAVHAMTVWAIDNNIDNSNIYFDAMLTYLREQRPDIFGSGENYQYGVTNTNELVAEAFTNPAFQHILMTTPMPRDLRRALGGPVGTIATWWDGFRNEIARLIGFTNFGKAGDSYLDGILRVTEYMFSDDDAGRAVAQQMVRDKFPGVEFGSAVRVREKGEIRGWAPEDNFPFDPVNMHRIVTAAADTVRAINTNAPGLSSRTRRMINGLKTIPMIAQDIRTIVGADNPADRLANFVRRHLPMARKNMEAGDALIARMMDHRRKHGPDAERLARIMHDATTQGVDPTVALGHANNRHISKKGVLDTQKRAMHAKLVAEVAQLSPEGRAILVDAGTFYRHMQDTAATKLVQTLVEEMANKGVLNLPPATSRQDLVDWVLHDGPGRLGTVNETGVDKAFQAALGATVNLFKNATGMRLLKGYYTPLQRRGDYVISAKKDINAPATARKVGNNQLVFQNKKDAVDYLKANDQILQRKPQSFWYDPLSGKKATPRDGGARQAFIVTVQDEYMEKFEKLGDAKAAHAQLVKPGSGFHSVKAPALARDLYQGTQSLMPQTAQKIIDRAKQHATDPTIKKAVEGVVTRAVLEQMAGTRIQRQRLLRRNVLGASLDATRAMHDYNVSMSNHLATLELRPQLNEAVKELNKLVEDHRYKGDGSGLRLSELTEAIRANIEANDAFDPSKASSRTLNAALTLSFIRYLASPAASIINSMQVGMVSLPYLASRHGAGRTLGALNRAYRHIDAVGVVRRGGRNIGRAAKGRATLQVTEPIMARLAGLPDAADLIDGINQLADVGLISHEAGMELDPAMINKNAIEKGLGYASEVFRAFPEAMEAINRSVTFIAAYRLSREDGRTHEQAVSAGIDAVNDTQGDYSTIVQPRILKSQLGRLVLQFKKYPMMMGRLMTRSAYDVARGDTAPVRKQAAKQLAYLAVTHALVAGLVGLPFMEVIKMLAIFAAGMGFSDDDWDAWENKVQGVFNQIMGNTLSEATMRGLPRLVGVDLSNRIGLDSMFLFGSPRSIDKANIKAWLFDALAGAPLGLIGNTLDGIANDDWSKILPIPKVAVDAIKAGTRATSGTVTASGRQVALPYGVWPALLQTLGFQPAVVARQFEIGGSGAKAKQDRQLSATRTTMMGRWVSARTPADRQAQWDIIRRWNTGRPPKERITMEKLQRSKAVRLKQQRELTSP